MKYILILLVSFAFGQDYDFGQNWYTLEDNGCGTWEQDEIIISEWANTDTIFYNPDGDTTWVYTNWKMDNSNIVLAVYCPCGCGWDDVYHRNRISEVGIRQIQEKRIKYEYIERAKTKYQSIIEGLIEQKPKVETMTSCLTVMDLVDITVGDSLFVENITFSALHYPPTLQDLMFEYAEECYNDSMEFGMYGDQDTGIGYNPPPKIDYKWIHRHPTFEGFIDWIRSKQ